MAGRRWSKDDLEFLARNFIVLSAAEMADRLRRSVSACRQKALLCGLYRVHPNADYGPAFVEFLRQKHAEGFSDAEIANAWGGERKRVGRIRTRLGLPHNAFSARRRLRVARKTRAQCREAGVRNLGELRVMAWRVSAAQRGWPADCTPLECQVLDQLEAGDKTRREMCAALGKTYHPQRALRSGRGTTLTAVLLRKGYVVHRGRRQFAPGKGKTEFVYALAPGFQRRGVSYKDPNEEAA